MIEAPAAARRNVSAQSITCGVHHLELNTDDMKMTTDFYQDVLGMPLFHATRVPAGLGTGPNNRGNPPYENIRHYFFDMGNDSTLAFFEIPKGEKPKCDRDSIAAMQHVSFAVNSERAEQLMERLKTAGIELIGPVFAAPGLMSVYFYDPNGIRLEFSWRPDDGTEVSVIAGMRQQREKALAELRTLSDDPAWIARASTNIPG